MRQFYRAYLMSLRCSAHNCLHNQNSKCTSSIIQVTSNKTLGKPDNYCATFTRDEGAYLLTAMERMSYPVRSGGVFDNEFAEEMDVMHMRRPGSPAVICNMTGCRYNRDKSCSAEDVAIGRTLKRSSLKFPCRTYRV